MSTAESFGRYTLERRLAVGGMAEIFLASLRGDAGFAKQLVVKRILPHLGADADFVKMFIDEAVLAARLTHPNIVQVYDFGSVAGSYYIAMEYVEGIDLHQLLRGAKLRGHPLRPAEVACVGEGLARGLAYAHGLADEQGQPLGIVHRDVSPHNLMLSRNGDAKIMDFGIARAAARLSRTATGTIKGKLAYMAPEQAEGRPADRLSDQFSLGVVLWEALAGARLFAAAQEVQLIQQVVACVVPPLQQVRADVPEPLAAAVMRMLRREPAERFPDLDALVAALTDFRFALGGAGIVSLSALVDAFRSTEAAGPDWAHVAEVGTRRIAAPRREAATPRGHELAAATPRRGEPERPARRHTRLPPRHRTTWRMGRVAPPRLGQRLARALRRRRLLVGLALALVMAAAVAGWALVRSRTAAPTAAAPRVGDAGEGTGRLTLRTDGPALRVYLGTTLLGSTPLTDAEVPAGPLQLRLINEAAGIWRNYEIYVPADGSAQGLIADGDPGRPPAPP